jgi:hypothetical protein
LKNDDFENHLESRAIALLDQIKNVMGKEIGESQIAQVDDDEDFEDDE